MSAQRAWARSGPFGENCLDFVSHAVEQTHRIGRRLGELAEPGDVYLLMGDLGAGKTCLTQGIAAGMGIGVPVTSPTFTLLNEYTTRSCGGRLSLFHADLYRLDNAFVEATDLGLDTEEYLYGCGVSVIEWAEKAASIWPADHLLVRLRLVSETKRSIRLEPFGPRYIRLVRDFRRLAFGV
jgi:tRNA threonylcarbamoyladenosine biosynthesis protein TsaE